MTSRGRAFPHHSGAISPILRIPGWLEHAQQTRRFWERRTESSWQIAPPGGLLVAPAEEFRETLRERFHAAAAADQGDILVDAGELHRAVQSGPHAVTGMPVACSVMRQEKWDNDVVEYALPSSFGSHASSTTRPVSLC
jgi:hypothetical protein